MQRAAALARRRGRDLGPPRVTEARPAFYALRARRLARLRDAAPPAVHRLAPRVRRDRRGARAALPRDRLRLDAGRVLARARHRRARARRAERPAARGRGSRAACWSRSPSSRSPAPSRSAIAGGDRAGAAGCSPSSPSAAFLVAGLQPRAVRRRASTTTSGFALAWGGVPGPDRRTSRRRRRSGRRPCSRRRSRPRSASPSDALDAGARDAARHASATGDVAEPIERGAAAARGRGRPARAPRSWCSGRRL